VATDSNPVNMQTYELCSDMIDVVIDVSCVYGDEEKGNGDNMLGYGRSERKSVYVCV
jgi:Ras-related GTP-binding protein C/D